MGCGIVGKRPGTHCSVNHVAMLGRTHGVSLPLRTMEDHKASFRYRPEPSDTWREHLLVGRAWQRAKAACDRLRRIYDRRLKARSQGRKESPQPIRQTGSTISFHPSERAAASRNRRGSLMEDGRRPLGGGLWGKGAGQAGNQVRRLGKLAHGPSGRMA